MAIEAFSGALERAEGGPPRPGRTKSFLLLLGPTGTGKTEMVKLAAAYLYGEAAKVRLQRLDMGEYQHPDSVLRLLGSPGQRALLGTAIDRLNEAGGGLLLLDEIEKAFPDLLTLLLSFDEARSTMADGSTRDLSACHVVMTSNLGAAEAAQMAHSGYSAIRRKVLLEAEKCFRKETLARFSATIVMNLLSFEVQEKIVANLLQKELSLQSHHLRRKIGVLGPEVARFLLSRGYSSDLGARNLRRTVEAFVGDALRLGAAQWPLLEGAGDRLSSSLWLGVAGDRLETQPVPRPVSIA